MYESKFDLNMKDSQRYQGNFATAKVATNVILGDPTSGRTKSIAAGEMIGIVTGLSTRIEGTLYSQVEADDASKFGDYYLTVKHTDFNYTVTRPAAPPSDDPPVKKGLSTKQKYFLAAIAMAMVIFTYLKYKK